MTPHRLLRDHLVYPPQANSFCSPHDCTLATVSTVPAAGMVAPGAAPGPTAVPECSPQVPVDVLARPWWDCGRGQGSRPSTGQPGCGNDGSRDSAGLCGGGPGVAPAGGCTGGGLGAGRAARLPSSQPPGAPRADGGVRVSRRADSRGPGERGRWPWTPPNRGHPEGRARRAAQLLLWPQRRTETKGSWSEPHPLLRVQDRRPGPISALQPETPRLQMGPSHTHPEAPEAPPTHRQRPRRPRPRPPQRGAGYLKGCLGPAPVPQVSRRPPGSTALGLLLLFFCRPLPSFPLPLLPSPFPPPTLSLLVSPYCPLLPSFPTVSCLPPLVFLPLSFSSPFSILLPLFLTSCLLLLATPKIPPNCHSVQALG